MDCMRCLLMEHPVSHVRLLWSYLSVISLVAAASFIAFISFPLMSEPFVKETDAPTVRHVVAQNAFSAPKVANRGVGQHIYTLSEGVTPPFVVSQVEPQYSDTARQEWIQGTVLLEGVVETDGSMSVTHIGLGLEPTLDHNAKYALEQWRFEPGRLNGVPVRVQIDVEVQFNLQ